MSWFRRKKTNQEQAAELAEREFLAEDAARRDENERMLEEYRARTLQDLKQQVRHLKVLAEFFVTYDHATKCYVPSGRESLDCQEYERLKG